MFPHRETDDQQQGEQDDRPHEATDERPESTSRRIGFTSRRLLRVGLWIRLVTVARTLIALTGWIRLWVRLRLFWVARLSLFIRPRISLFLGARFRLFLGARSGLFVRTLGGLRIGRSLRSFVVPIRFSPAIAWLIVLAAAISGLPAVWLFAVTLLRIGRAFRFLLRRLRIAL